MSYRVFAMDTYFNTPLGAYPFETRCEMLRELGYDALYLSTNEQATTWDEVARLAQVKSRHGLEVAAVYASLDTAGDDQHTNNRRILRLVETLEGCDHLELSLRSSREGVKSSDPAVDDAARRWLDKLLKAAAGRRITISLYPHIYFWLERVEDAVRLCRAYNHPQLRAVFCGFHWYAVDGQNLVTRLQEAAPWLRSVNLCGSRRVTAGGGLPATIETMDEGDLDNFALLGLLHQLGYRDLIGFQGYSIGGDVYAKLQRSLTVFRDMEHRLAQHPNWSPLHAR